MLIRRQFLQKTGKIKGFARFVEAQKLLVKVRQKLPPVRPIENITVVEAAKALGQRDFVLSPTRLSGDNVDFCHLQWKLVDVNVCGWRARRLILGHRRTHQMVSTFPLLVPNWNMNIRSQRQTLKGGFEFWWCFHFPGFLNSYSAIHWHSWCFWKGWT